MEIDNQIKEWLNNPQDYREGLRLLSKVTKKWKLQEKLMRKETTSHKYRLIHEFERYLKLKDVPEIKTGESSSGDPGEMKNESLTEPSFKIDPLIDYRGDRSSFIKSQLSGF
jgi:hypothetical protein